MKKWNNIFVQEQYSFVQPELVRLTSLRKDSTLLESLKKKKGGRRFDFRGRELGTWISCYGNRSVETCTCRLSIFRISYVVL